MHLSFVQEGLRALTKLKDATKTHINLQTQQVGL